jgi:hypothetical protein
VVAQVVVRTVGAAGGYWLADDWRYRFGRIGVFPFVFTNYFRIYAGNFWPAQFFLFHMVTTVVAPNSFGFAVLVGMVLQGIATALVYLLLRRLFGARPMVGLLLLWFAFTILTLDSADWVTVAYYMMPFQIALAGLALLFLRYLDRPSRAGVASIVAAELLALCWYEKAVFIPFALFALGAWFPVASAGPIGARRAWREHRQLWGFLSLALALYAVLYLALDAVGFTTPGGSSPAAKLGQDLTFTALALKSIIVSVFGGPWRWTSASAVAKVTPQLLEANPPLSLAVLAFVLFAVLVVWTSTHRRAARAAWLCLGVYLLAQVVLLAYGRVGVWGPALGRYYLYFADAAIPVTLALAFALLPTRSEHAVAARTEGPARWPRFLQFGAYLALATVFLVGVGVSSAGELSAWASNPGRSYVTNARASLGIAAHTPLILQSAPPKVLSPLFAALNTTQVILAPLPEHPKFQRIVDDHLFAVDPSGHIGPAHIVGWQSLGGPVPGCGWAITAPRASIPLNGSAFAWSWYVQVHYHASSTVLALVLFGKGSLLLRFNPGTHDVSFPITGGANSLEITGARPDAGLCVASVSVGNLGVEVLPPGHARSSQH